MRNVGLALLCLLALAAPANAGRHKSDKESQAQPTEQTTDSGSKSAPSAVDQSLDELLAKPVQPKPKQAEILQGHAESDAASAGAQQETGTVQGLKPLKPTAAPSVPTILKGNAVLNGGRAAVSDDPDKEDRELMIEWDRWRNKFLRAVQLQVQAGLNHPDFDEDLRPRVDPMTGYLVPRFPLGTTAWFYCEVTSDRRIKHLEITQSSGVPAYDRAVLEGVRALEGTSLLQYPSGSHRLLVQQEAGVRTSTTGDFHYQHFGDVERFRQ